MIQAKLSQLHCTDVPDLESYVPEQDDCVGLYVEATIGVDDLLGGGEIFGFMVCTPTWLAVEQQANSQPFVFGRHYLLLARYSYGVLRQAIESLCAQATGGDWESVANFLSRYGYWEFEDYRPYDPDHASV